MELIKLKIKRTLQTYCAFSEQLAPSWKVRRELDMVEVCLIIENWIQVHTQGPIFGIIMNYASLAMEFIVSYAQLWQQSKAWIGLNWLMGFMVFYSRLWANQKLLPLLF
ncbi:uncharacterized protein LOC117933454 isoform X3 [Vitis riparia]|uniref:uncharacterized protein LOC117933454 isoform X3 n=1 Tax=Vitis riparia TaxID=96939 RepID=UPI00155AEDDA|nr:uncharacterized protein LOC117933454 isoform X3 [Vitis riparia]